MSETKEKKSFAWSLWLPVTLAFIVISIGWYVRIQVARENPIEWVPLEQPASREAQVLETGQ